MNKDSLLEKINCKVRFLAVSNTSVTEIVNDDVIATHLSSLEGVTVMNSAIVISWWRGLVDKLVSWIPSSIL